MTSASCRVAPLDASNVDRWAALFASAGCPCYCRYWHFSGDKNAWLDRCAHRPEDSETEQRALVAARAPEARGLVAFSGEQAVGWMKLAPRVDLPKLRRLSVYRALDLGSDAGVFSIGCFLVHPAHRGRGVARALLAAAEEHGRAWGATSLEAYPRRTSEPVHPEEVWMGPERLFVERGYVAIAGEAPYLVYRKGL
jgi:GNAT superfamily N-acetyltransferase